MILRSAKNIVVVTVTYGNRPGLLSQMLSSILPDPLVGAVYIVDNAATFPIEDCFDSSMFDRVHVTHLGKNTGSANGYKVGIETALRDGAEYIWLLDDDNQPNPDALDKLVTAWQLLVQERKRDCLALVSFRPDHQSDIAMGVPLAQRAPRPDSFFGFHIAELTYKIWRRTPWGKPIAPAIYPELIAMDHAPYSGLFFHRSLIDHIGLPDTEYVIYADDKEFTSRLKLVGGAIYLVSKSRLRDLESSWNIKSNYNNSYDTWLRGGSDFRVYYSARNQVCYEFEHIRKSGLYALNRSIYLVTMILMAIRYRRIKRLKLFLTAIRDGATGRLGIHPMFPLP